MRFRPSAFAGAAVAVLALGFAGAALSAQSLPLDSIAPAVPLPEAALPATLPIRAPDGLFLRTALDLSVAYTYRSANELVEPYADKNGIDFTKNYLELPPLARFSVDLGQLGGLSLGFTMDLRRQFGPSFEGYFPSSNLPVGFSNGASYIPPSNNAISRGILSWTSRYLDLSIGRDKVDYGGIVQGSIFPSARLPYLDAFRGRARLGPFTLDYMISSQDAIPSWDGIDVDPNSGTPPSTSYGWYDDPNPTSIIEVYHSISWDFGQIRARLAENVMLARAGNRYTVTDFLPVMFWHQASILPNNTTILASVDWTPSPRLSLSFQGGLDDFNANTVGIGDNGVPTIPACVLGLEYGTDTGLGALDLYVEAGYTDTLWGNFTDTGQGGLQGDDTLARAQYRYLLSDNGEAGLIPLTSPYGPGALWCRLDASQELGDTGLAAGPRLLLLGKNVAANLIDTPYDTSDANAPWEFYGQLGLALKWRSGAFDFSAAPAACVRDYSWWVESSFAVTYHLRGSTPIAAAQ
ncbi:MAG TPA: hypothetical protein VMV90_03650 [Rectinemataceae bacterium]|nr:hypothetical protein [Rectinemataceae bacterium]